MKLTAENYYSTEANRAFWSASMVKEMLSCPARALAEMRGEYARPDTTALLIGSYIDAYFEGAMDDFKAAHPEIFKRDGELKSDYIMANRMIARAESEPLFMEYLRGEKQRIVTGNLFGLPFKAKYDVYLSGERIVDLKTAKDLKPTYRAGQGKVTFADAWNWTLQMAIYQALDGNSLPCYLAVITKEDPPDIDIVQIPQYMLDAEMDILAEKMPYFDAIKQGVIEPERCESCAYCRATKKLTEPKQLSEFYEIGGNDIE